MTKKDSNTPSKEDLAKLKSFGDVKKAATWALNNGFVRPGLEGVLVKAGYTEGRDLTLWLSQGENRRKPGEKFKADAGSSVQELFNKIKRSSVFEDRLEYDAEDLKKAYSLSDADAKELHRLLQAEVVHNRKADAEFKEGDPVIGPDGSKHVVRFIGSSGKVHTSKIHSVSGKPTTAAFAWDSSKLKKADAQPDPGSLVKQIEEQARIQAGSGHPPSCYWAALKMYDKMREGDPRLPEARAAMQKLAKGAGLKFTDSVKADAIGDENDPYMKGRRAYQGGKKLTDNPYPAAFHDHTVWAEGFKQWQEHERVNKQWQERMNKKADASGPIDRIVREATDSDLRLDPKGLEKIYGLSPKDAKEVHRMLHDNKVDSATGKLDAACAKMDAAGGDVHSYTVEVLDTKDKPIRTFTVQAKSEHEARMKTPVGQLGNRTIRFGKVKDLGPTPKEWLDKADAGGDVEVGIWVSQAQGLIKRADTALAQVLSAKGRGQESNVRRAYDLLQEAIALLEENT
jgi:hypothetical protein